MGICKSVNKDELNDSFPDNYIVIQTKEDFTENNIINYEKITERLGNGIIVQSQIIDGRIEKQVFKKKNLLDKKSIERFERLEKERLERKEKERLERLKKERLEKERIEKERIEEIKKRVFETKQNYYKVLNNITQQKTIDTSLIEDMNEMGAIMKQQIIEDQQINPQNYINIDQTVKSSSDQNFPIALLAKNLELNGITTAIQKKSTNQDLTKTCLQLMTNGLITKQKCEVKFDFGEKKNNEIINDQNERNKFINEWKTKISKKLGVNPEDIIITNLRKGCFKADIFLKQNENFEELASVLNALSKESPKIKSINQASILKGIVLSPEMFDVRGNQSPNGYEKEGLRGGKIYKGPIGWTGHGLCVWGQYDGGNNTWLGMTGNTPGEWCVAYHGTSIHYVKSILISKLKAGDSQGNEKDDDLNHPGEEVGKGVYVTHEITVAELFSPLVEGYKCVFMCRVNPKLLREPKKKPDYWVVSGTSNDIRPYRLLIKYVGNYNNYF